LVAGERRWRSCRALGWERIEAVVLHVDEARAFELAVAENVHRNSLLPLEEAAAYQQIQADRGLSQSDLARHLGVDRRRVSEKLSLLRLPDEVKALLSERSDTFTELYGLTLAAAPPEVDVVALARRTVELGWSLRRLREELAKGVSRPDVLKGGGRRPRASDGLLTMRIVPSGGFVLRVSATTDEDAVQALEELKEALSTLKKRFVSADNNQPATRRDQGKKRSIAINI
jgi:ParB-like chromosome segregation protein Spo0J